MRRQLGDIVLTAGRRTARTAVFTTQAGLAAIAAVSVLFERHHVAGRGWHSTWAEMAAAPLLVMIAVVVVAMLAARRPRFDIAVAASAATAVGAVTALGFLIGVHALEHPLHTQAYGLAFLSLSALSVLGVIATLAEIGLRRRERAVLEAGEPSFPTARVVVRR